MPHTVPPDACASTSPRTNGLATALGRSTFPPVPTTRPHAITTHADRTARWALIALVALAFALRLAGAQGSLWLDEAWSAMLAAEVKTPAGVILGINHDNNHHLNSLWLQWVGLAAPTWEMRLLSVVTGTLAVPVAAAIARPRGIVFALVAALLFAVSPVLVTMGSEARGYAPMALALLVAILFVDRVLAGDESFHRPTTLALCFVLGALSQLTMVFGILAVTGWAFFAWWRRESFGAALRRWFALFTMPLLALAALIAVMVVAALTAPKGFQFGFYEPFTFMLWLHALVELAGYTIGYPIVSVLLPLAVIALVIVARRAGVVRLEFYLLAILAFPIGMAVLRSGNPGHPRYYLVAAIALLLLLGELIGDALTKPGRARWIGTAALAAIVAGSLWQDGDLAINRRGDPAAAIRLLQRLRPQGASVLVDRETGLAMLVIAARQAHYPLRTVNHRACPAQDFVFVDRYKGERWPQGLNRCGVVYTPILEHYAHGLSGTHWTLYARAP